MKTPNPESDETARIASDESFTPRYDAREAQFAPGTMIGGRYRIAGILGKGGMGEVYRADDVKLGQPVALKFLPARLARDPVLLSHLHDEVRHGRQISHPNVCRIYDIGEADGAHFVAMEFVDGEDLARLLRRIGRLANDKALDIAHGIAAGLNAAHAKGILHRDLKPANVMVDSHGDARITDFGLALPAGDDQEGQLVGTPAYMAPELLQGEPATIQSDLYALGLVMYELFTGHRAHGGKTLPDRMRELTSDITTPSHHIRDIDPVVERVILRCLASDAAQRPRSAREVIQALPGGDPLAAAMAAGETPSPRVVAASGTEGILSRGVAWSLLAAATLLAIITVMLMRSRSLGNYVPFDRSPEVLADRAQTIAKELGVLTNGAPIRVLHSRPRYLDWLMKERRTRFRSAVAAGPGPILLRLEYGLTPAESIYTPPLGTAPGRTTIEVDTAGRLSLLLAAPDTDVPPRPVEWNKLVERAGLSLDALKPIPPSAPPPVPFDARAAWSGAFPNSDIPIRVEAAAWHGMPVFFSISGDWQPRNNAEPVERPRRVAATISTVMTAMAIVLAWRNFRRRRGDRNGALRVSIGTFIIALTGALLGTSWPAVAMERLGWTFELVSESLGVAALAYVLYLAVEPYLRQRWPDRLISWSRLLAARFRDPMVGRDILIGLVGSTAYALISVLTPVIASLLSTPQAAPLLRGTSALLGVTNTIALALSMILSAAGVAFLNMTVLVVATIVLRKRIAAGAVLLLLHFAIYRSAVTIPLLVAISLAFLMTYIAYRFGLLTVFVMYAFYLMIYLFPVVPVPWATALAAIVYVAFAAVAVWAFHTSLGGQSPFADTLDS